MKILFDHQIFSFQDYGGVSRIFYELASGIKKTNNEVIIEGRFSNNIFLPKLKKGVIPFLPNLKFPYKNYLVFYLNYFFGEKKVSQADYDLLHVTYFHPYFLNKLKGKPYVVTVYDMIHEIFSKDYKDLRNKTSVYKKEVVTKANQIIAISENTKKDLIKIYKIPADKINVVYLANPLDKITPTFVHGLPKKYILFVGSRIGYDNFEFFIKSISSILRGKKDIFLVCSGGGDFSDAEKKKFAELNITEKVVHINFASDGQSAYIFKKAIIYITPTLYEGFGLQILEAFSMSCPVIASKVSSIPEVAGDAVYYIDPKNADSINESVEMMLKNEKLRSSLVKKGKIQLKKFSWDKTVKATMRVYEKAIAD